MNLTAMGSMIRLHANLGDLRDVLSSLDDNSKELLITMLSQVIDDSTVVLNNLRGAPSMISTPTPKAVQTQASDVEVEVPGFELNLDFSPKPVEITPTNREDLPWDKPADAEVYGADDGMLVSARLPVSPNMASEAMVKSFVAQMYPQFGSSVAYINVVNADNRDICMMHIECK